MGVIIYPSVRFHRYEQHFTWGLLSKETTFYLSPIGGGQPLSSPKRRSLGEPLPHQQADITQASPKAINLYPFGTIRDYPVFRRAIPDFGGSTYVLLPRLPLSLRTVRLACLIHAASIHPELGSNSN